MQEVIASILSVLVVCEGWQIFIAHGWVKELNKAKDIQWRARDAQRTNAKDVFRCAAYSLPSQFSFSAKGTEYTALFLEDYKEYWRRRFLESDFDSWNKYLVDIPYDKFFPITFRIFLDGKCLRDFHYYEPCNGHDETLRLYNVLHNGETIVPTTLCLDLHKLCLAYFINTQDIDPAPNQIRVLSEQIAEWEQNLSPHQM